MGKIFRLSERHSCFKETVELIENSFNYDKSHSFEIDFAPLIDKSNHNNCFVFVDDSEKVIGHVGVKERKLTLNGKSFTVALLGGIAVDEKRRGEGVFQTLFQDVLAEKRSDVAFFLLWSDRESLYQKFGFSLCGNQFELSRGMEPSTYSKTTYSALNLDEKKQMHSLFSSSYGNTFLTLDRSDSDWDLISKISSADLYVDRHQGKICSYYFQNKGQDLPEIIYEYGTEKDLKTFVNEISSFGKVWMPSPLVETEVSQYQYMMCPGDTKLFSELVKEYTQDLFEIRNINVMKQEVFFDFNQETLVLSTEDFLRGVFGPGQFEELGTLKPFFISGLDSI